MNENLKNESREPLSVIPILIMSDVDDENTMMDPPIDGLGDPKNVEVADRAVYEERASEGDAFEEGGEEEVVEDDQEMAIDNSEGSVHASKKSKEVVKKPTSKWIVYLGEQRPLVSQAHPGLSVAQITKTIAETYKELSPEELARLDEIVSQQKIAYQSYLDTVSGTTVEEVRGKSKHSPDCGLHELTIPLARVKRVMKLDEDTKTVSKDALVTVTKAVELFVGRLAVKAATTAALRGGKTIQLADVLHTIHSGHTFDFLQFDFPKPETRKPSQATVRKPSTDVPLVSSKQNIESFFGRSKRKPEDDNDINEIANTETER